MGKISEEIRAIFSKKDLIKYLVFTELKTNYKGTFLGFIWILLDPLFMMLVYVLLVSVIFQRGGAQFPILLFTALISWKWFVTSGTNSIKSFLSNGSLIQTISVPLTVFPISKVIIGMITFFASFAALIPMLFIFDANFTLNLLWLPILIILQFFFTLGFSLVFAVGGIHFLDLSNIMAFTFRLWFYFSPALYALDFIPEKFREIYLIANPFASLFESYKNVLVHGLPPNQYIIIFAIEGIILTLLGLKLISKNKSFIVKHV